jgi:hypothetical protein
MANEISIYDPRTMGKVISRLAPVKTFFRDTFFKNVQTFNTKSIDVDMKKGSRALAQFVHPRAGSAAVLNEGYETRTFTPPTIAEKKVTGVDDLLTRSPGEALYSGTSPAERAVLKMADDFRELNERISRREEWMSAQAILTGTIPIIGKGVNYPIDFGFSNKETITTAAKKWSAATADPLADIERWHMEVQRKGFVNCDICVMAADVAAAFINNEKVQKLLDVRAYDLAVIAPRDLANGVKYLGTIHKLGLSIYQYNEWYLDNWTNPAAPEEKPIIPSGTVVLISTGAQYSMYYGAVTLIDENTKGFFTVQGNRVPRTWIENDPPRRFLELNSLPLPVPHEVDSWFVAVVL